MHDTRPPYRRQPRRRKPKFHQFVAVDLTVGSPSTDIPALGHVLVATDLSAGAPVLGAPALEQEHNLRSATARGRHDLVAVDVAVGSPVVGADPVDEQPQPFRRRRITKEIRVIRILCTLAVEGVPIARVRDRQGDLILKREVENKFRETLSQQTFHRGLGRYRKGERSE